MDDNKSRATRATRSQIYLGMQAGEFIPRVCMV